MNRDSSRAKKVIDEFWRQLLLRSFARPSTEISDHGLFLLEVLIRSGVIEIRNTEYVLVSLYRISFRIDIISESLRENVSSFYLIINFLSFSFLSYSRSRTRTRVQF